MKIMITGAAGGIGSCLAKALWRQDYLGVETVLVDNLRIGNSDNLTGENKEKLKVVDITSPEFIDLVVETKPDVIVHLAAITSLAECENDPQECIRVNVQGTVAVLEAARTANVSKVIFSSTSALYDNNGSLAKPSTEHDYTGPDLFYALSKKMAENVCRSYISNYGMNVIILRFFNVIGANQDAKRQSPPLINYLVREFKAGRQPVLHSSGDQRRDYIDVWAVTEFIDLCCEHDLPPGIDPCFNLCTGETLSVKEIVEVVQNTLGTDIVPIYRDAWLYWDSYPRITQGPNPLSKDVIAKEVEKQSLGSNKKAMSLDWSWYPNTDLKAVVANTVRCIK